MLPAPPANQNLVRRLAIPDVGLEELAKYFVIVVGADQPAPMFSPFIDEIWHELLKTEGYADWSQKACGYIIEHVPGNGTGTITWINDYHERFGQLPPEWFAAESGLIDQAAYAKYLKTFELEASWDCKPAKRPAVKPAAAIDACWDCGPVISCNGDQRRPKTIEPNRAH